jgi:hypothetical protein
VNSSHSHELLHDVDAFLQWARCGRPSIGNSSAFWSSRPFLTRAELRGLSTLLEGRATACELARSLGLEACAAEELLHALLGIGTLEVWDGRYALTEAARRYLSAVQSGLPLATTFD